MDSQHEERISRLLGEFRENEGSNDDGAQAHASTSADWYDGPYKEQCSKQHPQEEPNNMDEGMLRNVFII